jgi:hypothetical protein
MPEKTPLAQTMSIVTPIITFIAGFLLSLSEKFWERKRNINKIKSILFKELSENFKKINPHIPPDKSYPPNIIQVPALSGMSISTAVYDAYLNRLAELDVDALHNIFDAYQWLKIYQKACIDVFNMKPEELDVLKSIESRIKLMTYLQCMLTTHSNTEKALSEFTAGKKFLNGEAKNKGADYNKIMDSISKGDTSYE